MATKTAVYRRRRAAAIIALAAAAAVVVFAVTQLTGTKAAEPRAPAAATPAKPARKPKPLAQLPRGGRRILPDFRVVAYYGAPQDRQLGALGIGTPAHAAAKLAHQAKGYARKSRPVLPAMEL